ncbi:hypothetical protein XENOCAPTIV_029237 [Xenoophorus captivus]|uniref:Uncharacterized protein n=1 Tax=Xenoophorus captivus TaxID=1517983 RepID=A0ABV0R5G5_9TELE
MSQKIQELENSALAQKPWQLSGEVTAHTRPENSMLEEDVEFEQTSRMGLTLSLFTFLLHHIQTAQASIFIILLFQHKTEEEENPAHVEIQKLMDTLFLKLDALSNFHFTPKPDSADDDDPIHVYCLEQPVPEVKVVSNLPSITMEEVAPVSTSDATLLAPEEVKDEGKDKALRSSQAFFSHLQDQVKSQIKSAKKQSSNKKKQKDISVSKLKL